MLEQNLKVFLPYFSEKYDLIVKFQEEYSLGFAIR